eukprot:5619502-Pyramimonas_sp.AAC.1
MRSRRRPRPGEAAAPFAKAFGVRAVEAEATKVTFEQVSRRPHIIKSSGRRLLNADRTARGGS